MNPEPDGAQAPPLPTSAPRRFARRAVIAVLVLVGALIVAAQVLDRVGGQVSPETRKFLDNLPDSSPKPEPATTAGFTLDDFAKLSDNMGIDEVRSQLGSRGTLQGVSTIGDLQIQIAIWVWRNTDGSAVSVTFRDGGLMSKVQMGLR